jgi:hypothetical protein
LAEISDVKHCAENKAEGLYFTCKAFLGRYLSALSVDGTVYLDVATLLKKLFSKHDGFGIAGIRRALKPLAMRYLTDASLIDRP